MKVARQLKGLRKKIDKSDRTLLKALSLRFKSVEKVGKLKRANKLPIYQKARWEEVVEDRVKQAKKLKINEEFMRSLLELIHQEAIRIQKGQSGGKRR